MPGAASSSQMDAQAALRTKYRAAHPGDLLGGDKSIGVVAFEKTMRYSPDWTLWPRGLFAIPANRFQPVRPQASSVLASRCCSAFWVDGA